MDSNDPRENLPIFVLLPSTRLDARITSCCVPPCLHMTAYFFLFIQFHYNSCSYPLHVLGTVQKIKFCYYNLYSSEEFNRQNGLSKKMVRRSADYPIYPLLGVFVPRGHTEPPGTPTCTPQLSPCKPFGSKCAPLTPHWTNSLFCNCWLR